MYTLYFYSKNVQHKNCPSFLSIMQQTEVYIFHISIYSRSANYSATTLARFHVAVIAVKWKCAAVTLQSWPLRLQRSWQINFLFILQALAPEEMAPKKRLCQLQTAISIAYGGRDFAPCYFLWRPITQSSGGKPEFCCSITKWFLPAVQVSKSLPVLMCQSLYGLVFSLYMSES